MITYESITTGRETSWERLSAAQVVKEGRTDCVGTFRRFCCRRHFIPRNEVRQQKESVVPRTTKESVLLMVTGTSAEALEDFARVLKEEIDHHIETDKCVYQIIKLKPPGVDDYLITCSSRKCPHAHFSVFSRDRSRSNSFNQ